MKAKHAIAIAALCIATGTAAHNADTTATKQNTTDAEMLNERKQIRAFQQEERHMKQKSVKEWMGRHGTNWSDTTSDVRVMTQIEANTRPNWKADGWNLYGWIAFFIALLSSGLAVFTLYEQWKTSRNTKNVSREAQRHLLNEMLRHLYRNFIITYTMQTKMSDTDYKGYPSEEHFIKMHIPLENMHMEAFYGDDEKLQRLHVLYLNMRNYNNEVDVAMSHIVDSGLSRATKEEDFRLLIFKISYLTQRIIETIADVWGERPEYKDDMRRALHLSLSGATNAKDNVDVPDSGKFDKITPKLLSHMSYNMLYDADQMEQLCAIFNHDVHEERKKNSNNSWKVRIILPDETH